MPVAPDLGQRVATPHERVVVGHAAVVVQAHDGPHVVGHVQRRVVVHHVGVEHAVAHRQVQVSVQAEGHAPGEVIVVVVPGVRLEDLHDVGDPAIVPAPPHHRRGTLRPVVVGLAVAEVQPVVFGKVGVGQDVHEATLALVPVDFRPTRNRLRLEHAVAHDAQAARTLHDQHLAAGQPRHGPGVVEAVGDGDHAEVVAGGGMHPLDAVRTGSGRVDPFGAAGVLPRGLTAGENPRDRSQSASQKHAGRDGSISHGFSPRSMPRSAPGSPQCSATQRVTGSASSIETALGTGTAARVPGA